MDLIIGAKYALCYACASVFEDKGLDIVECPVCGYQIDKNRYNVVYKYANDAVKFGYMYRHMYERDVLHRKVFGGSTTLYALGAYEQYLVFAAVSALSGIIGNASYDLTKALIRRLRNSPDKRQKNEIGYITDLSDERKIQEFVEYIEDFAKGLKKVEPPVLSLIKEEMIAHKAVQLLHPKFGKKPRMNSKQALIKVREKAEAKLAQQSAPKQPDFENFWKDVDKGNL